MVKYSVKEIGTFVLLWLAYGSAYLLRKPYGIIKENIQNDMVVSDSNLGYIDLAFALPYALISLLLANVGDLLGPKLTLAGGLIGSAVASSVLGISYNYAMFLTLTCISGAFQSLTWPASASLISIWFSEKSRTSIMGIFGTNTLAGSVVGSLLTVYINEMSNWKNVFYLPSVITLVVGVMVLLFINTSLPSANKLGGSPNKSNDDSKLKDKNNGGLPFWKVLNLPVVPYVSITLLCSKGIRNAVLFWLPFYLQKVLNYDQRSAGLIALTFDIGGFLGAIFLTRVVDKCMNHRDALALTIFSILGCIFISLLLLVKIVGSSMIYVSLFCGGAFNFSTDIIIGGSVASKIGEKYNAKSSVTGVINGIGSLGNVIEGPIVAWLSHALGMGSLVPFIALLSFISFLSSLRALFIQKKEVVNEKDSNSGGEADSPSFDLAIHM